MLKAQSLLNLNPMKLTRNLSGTHDIYRFVAAVVEWACFRVGRQIHHASAAFLRLNKHPILTLVKQPCGAVAI